MKSSRSIMLVSSMAVAALALAGCAGGTTDGSDDGDTITVAYVPKLVGDPYFELVNQGGQRAAADYGNIEWLFQGPNTADAAGQAQSVRSFIQQGVDVLLISPVDPNSMAPLIQEARDAGIRVATVDTDAPDSEREVFVNQATAEGIAEGVIDALADAIGGEGKFSILSCGETDQNLNNWIDLEKAYAAEAYPDLELVDVRYSGGDQGANNQIATDMINGTPDLKGLIGQCVPTSTQVAQAVRDAGKIGEIATVSIGLPSLSGPYLEDGSASAAILWDPEEMGYLAAWAGLQLGLDVPFEKSNKVSDTLTDVEYVASDNMLILGPALRITKENMADYPF